MCKWVKEFYWTTVCSIIGRGNQLGSSSVRLWMTVTIQSFLNQPLIHLNLSSPPTMHPFIYLAISLLSHPNIQTLIHRRNTHSLEHYAFPPTNISCLINATFHLRCPHLTQSLAQGTCVPTTLPSVFFSRLLPVFRSLPKSFPHFTLLQLMAH